MEDKAMGNDSGVISLPIVRDGLLNRNMPQNAIGKAPARMSEDLDNCKIANKEGQYHVNYLNFESFGQTHLLFAFFSKFFKFV